jgi:hypothetical protein
MSTMAPATQPTLEDVLTHMSAQIAALTREVKELRALKEDVDELRAFNDARLVQLEESNEDLVSMSATPKVVIVQPSAPLEATQPPADQDMEEPFQEVKGRKPRKRRPSVASLEDQAVEPGPSHRPPSAEVPKKAKKSNTQAPQAKPNRPAPAKQVAQNKPPAENKIPPIIIRDAAKWASVSSAMTTRQIKFSKAKTCIDGIRVNTVTVDDFRALTRLLEERKVPYHSFALPEQKTLRAVLRTVPCEIAIDDVRADLEEQGLAPIKVTRMTSSRSKKPLPLVLVEVPKDKGAIFELKAVCHLSVTVERPHKKGAPSQCHRCQRFHHSQRHCHALPKCVKCGESHDTHSCEKTNDDAAKCANCGGAHTASYRGCPRFPRGPQAKKSSGSAAPKPQQKPAAASAKQSATPAAPVRPSAPKTAPATKTANNDNASKSFADAASSKKTAPPAPPQATPKQPPAIGKALTEILKAIQTSNTKEEILQNVLAIIPKILLDC